MCWSWGLQSSLYDHISALMRKRLSSPHFLPPSSPMWGHSKKALSISQKMALIRHQICLSWILDFSASRPEEINACHVSHTGISVIVWTIFLMTFVDTEVLLEKPEILIDFSPNLFFLNERFSNVSKFQQCLRTSKNSLMKNNLNFRRGSVWILASGREELYLKYRTKTIYK